MPQSADSSRFNKKNNNLTYVETTKQEVFLRSWYRGSISRQEAEGLLLKQIGGRPIYVDGMFLVRDSQATPGELSLSVK